MWIDAQRLNTVLKYTLCLGNFCTFHEFLASQCVVGVKRMVGTAVQRGILYRLQAIRRVHHKSKTMVERITVMHFLNVGFQRFEQRFRAPNARGRCGRVIEMDQRRPQTIVF